MNIVNDLLIALLTVCAAWSAWARYSVPVLLLVVLFAFAGLLFRIQAKGGPFLATCSTILMSYCITSAMFAALVHPTGPPMGFASVFVFAFTTYRMWVDLFKRFPPGGSKV